MRWKLKRGWALGLAALTLGLAGPAFAQSAADRAVEAAK